MRTPPEPSEPSDEKTRWLDRPAGSDEPEDRIAELMREAQPAEGLGAAARERVWERLSPSEAPEERQVRVRPLARLRWSLAAGVFLTSSVVVGGVSAPRWWPALKARVGGAGEQAPAPKPRPPVARRPSAPVAPAEPEPPAPQAPAELAEALALAVPPPPPSARRAPAEPAELPVGEVVPVADEAPPIVEAAPSALANETALLGVALARLRQQRDARGALAALDAYDARVPQGALRREADAARVDALLLLRRRDEALALLQTLALQTRGRDQELRVVRGELQAATSCERAVADFDGVLAAAPPPALAERALHGRATCLARLGDTRGALRDLRDYLRLYPEGRYAAEARRIVEGNAL
jgi:hypothetical protein